LKKIGVIFGGRKMWIVKWIFSAVVILLVLGFALQNQSHTVSLTFIPGRYETEFVPVWVVVYVSFGSGVLFWLMISIFQVIKLKAEIRRVRKDNEQLRQEVEGLRKVSIEEGLTASEVNSGKISTEMKATPV
jgi:uncharacterized integral membrane protein